MKSFKQHITEATSSQIDVNGKKVSIWSLYKDSSRPKTVTVDGKTVLGKPGRKAEVLAFNKRADAQKLAGVYGGKVIKGAGVFYRRVKGKDQKIKTDGIYYIELRESV